MFKKIKEFFVGKPQEVAVEAPYKVEVAPTPVTATSAELKIVAELVDAIHDTDKPATEVPVAAPTKAKKAPAAKKATAVKKPRAPKKPKAS